LTHENREKADPLPGVKREIENHDVQAILGKPERNGHEPIVISSSPSMRSVDKGSAAIVVKGDLLDTMTNRSKSSLVKSANEPKVMGKSSFI
jgi:hypothetical protein